MSNINNDPITVWGAALVLGNLLLHHHVAAGMEADRAAVGALDLHVVHLHVGPVDEGAGRQFKRKKSLDARRPAGNEGQFGVWLSLQQAVGASPADHVRPGSVKCSFKEVNLTKQQGNRTQKLQRTHCNRGDWTIGHNLGKAARSTDKSSSCLLCEHFAIFLNVTLNFMMLT